MTKTLRQEIETILRKYAQIGTCASTVRELEQAIREAVERAYPGPTPDDSIDPLDQFKTNLLKEISGTKLDESS